jgi:hypothetical protein
MNLPTVGDELGHGSRVRAHWRVPNDAGVSALFHRDPRFAKTGPRTQRGCQPAGASPRTAGSPTPPRAPESLAPLAFLRPCFKVDFRQHASGLADELAEQPVLDR